VHVRDLGGGGSASSPGELLAVVAAPSRIHPSSCAAAPSTLTSVSTLPIASHCRSLRVPWVGLEDGCRNQWAREVRPWRRRALRRGRGRPSSVVHPSMDGVDYNIEND
jgi:hypothetical protein